MPLLNVTSTTSAVHLSFGQVGTFGTTGGVVETEKTSWPFFAEGSVTEPEALMDEARALASQLAAKPPHVVRFAKRALDHIDPIDMHTNYRLEQGFTYQLNLMGEGSRARNAFVRGERTITR